MLFKTTHRLQILKTLVRYLISYRKKYNKNSDFTKNFNCKVLDKINVYFLWSEYN